MTLKSTLMATTAAAVIAMGGTAFAATPGEGETLAPAAEQTFTYRVGSESPSIDPGVAEDVDGGDIVRNLFEGLMNQDADGNLIPGVAESYTVSDDLMTYTFTLRDAKWSNGDPVLASDFVYAWRRAASPELASPYSWYLELMAIENISEVIAGDKPLDALGISAPDDHTIVVTITQPLPYFPQMLTHYTTFPVPQKVVEELGSEWTKPGNMVSNGAYVLTEHVQEEKLEMERNPMYWDNDHTIIEKVTALVISDEDTALTRYLAGEMDRTDIPSGQFPALEAEYPDDVMSVPNACSYYYTINLTDTGNPALQDVKVRQALSLAVDRDIIVENVLAGGQKPAYTFTHWATAGFETPETPIAAMTQAERNETAKTLLEEAGYGSDNPLSLDLIYNSSASHEAIAVAISQMWKQTLGVEVTTSNEEWKVFLNTRGDQNYEVARAGWCADYNEASTFLDLMQSESGYNDAKYVNSAYDALMADAKTSANPQADYTAAELLIAEDVPIIPIYHYSADKMLDSSIKGWAYNNFQQNWYARDLYRVAE